MGDINKALKEKFLCSAQFAQDIEAIVKDDNLGYIDAIVHYCEQNAIDVESVPKLISKPLKEKLKWKQQNSTISNVPQEQNCPYDWF